MKSRTRKKICVVTGSRAEYGLLRPLMTKIQKSGQFELRIIATSMHLSHEFGFTYREIEKDGFKIHDKVDILLNSDSSSAVSKSIGLGCIGLSESFERLQPDLVVLLGDRFETFAAATAAHVARIPIAHVHGGELTEGAFDDAFRHAITKMSALHFVSAEAYRRRVIQLGEQPRRVYNVGAIGLDNIRDLTLLSKAALEKALDLRFAKRNILVTFHPATAIRKSARKQCEELLTALSGLDDTLVLFTKANADTEGRLINAMIEKFVRKSGPSARVFSSLGQLRYLSLMQYIDGVVGNSSSGIIEAPSFHIGTINIGHRQDGRIKAVSVIDCAPKAKSIRSALDMLLDAAFRRRIKRCKNPYGDGHSSQRIMSVLEKTDFNSIRTKHFFDLPTSR